MAKLRVLPMLLTGLTAVTVFAPPAARAVDGKLSAGAWTVEKGTAEPSFAVAEATRSTLNVENVVLACEAGEDDHRVLQLQLYLTEEGVLRPTYPHTAAMKDDPKAVVAIDGREFRVDLLFSESHVVLADAQDGPWPMLSAGLADAIQAGRTMTVRVDLLAEAAGAPAMDGETVVNLRAPGGAEAIAAMRRCAGGGEPSVAEVRAR